MPPLVPVVPTTPPLKPPTWANAVVAQESAAAKRMALVMGVLLGKDHLTSPQ